MALKPTTIRFAAAAYDLLQREADEQGVSLAQYVREAALIRLVVDRHEREDNESHVALIHAARQLARDSEAMDRRADDP
jgi:hypothetical protein